MKKILLFPTLAAMSLLATSCGGFDFLGKKDVRISIVVNYMIVEDDAGEFSTKHLPSFHYLLDAEEDLVSDYAFKSGNSNLGHDAPTTEGSYKYAVTVQGNSKYKSAFKEISYSLHEERETPTVSIYLSVDEGEPYEITGTSVGSIMEGYSYTFTVEVPLGVTYSTSYSSNTTSYGNNKPDLPGDYNFTVITDVNDNYRSVTRSVSYSIESSSVPPVTGTADINIFAINDFHGQIEVQSGRAGLVKTYSYFKAQRDLNPDALLLDQGDTFQGSIYSNYNHGQLITDVMNYCQFDARTIGNHDFDWGTSALKSVAESSYSGYKTPTLGANLVDYDFDTRTTTGTFRDDLGVVKTTTRVLQNGIKVGIVGVIGTDQITSINTIMAKDFVFYNHIQTIKMEATNLKEFGECDVVICCVHAPASSSMGYDLGDYVDLVLCGHSHEFELEHEDDLYYAQFGSYSQAVGNITLTYDFAKHKVTSTTVNEINTDTLSNVSDDATIVSLLNQYSQQCDNEASEVLVKNASGSFYSSGALPRVMARAIYDKAVTEGYTIDLAILNNARASLYTGTWKYSHIYQAFPFDNLIFIAQVKGSELIKELVQYTNYFCRSESFNDTSFVSNNTYTIACIDYMFFHTGLRTYNDNPYYRNYDYFNVTAGNYIGQLNKNYREILKDWLISHNYPNSGTLSATDFDTNNPRFASFGY